MQTVFPSAIPADSLHGDESQGEPYADRWLIWSNEHRAWWGPGCCGYPQNIRDAGRYSLGQAVSICTQRSWTHGQVPPETMIHESALPHVISGAA